jgi:hypothetical protein
VSAHLRCDKGGQGDSASTHPRSSHQSPRSPPAGVGFVEVALIRLRDPAARGACIGLAVVPAAVAGEPPAAAPDSPAAAVRSPAAARSPASARSPAAGGGWAEAASPAGRGAGAGGGDGGGLPEMRLVYRSDGVLLRRERRGERERECERGREGDAAGVPFGR